MFLVKPEEEASKDDREIVLVSFCFGGKGSFYVGVDWRGVEEEGQTCLVTALWLRVLYIWPRSSLAVANPKKFPKKASK